MFQADWEDIRVKMEDWPALKATFEFGSMPLVETEDGKKLGQTNSIIRYLAKRFGYYPEDAYDAWRAESLIDGLMDVHLALYAVHFNATLDEEEKKKKVSEIIGTQFDKFVGILEKRLKDNSSQEFIVGDKLSVADIVNVAEYTGLYTNGDNNSTFGAVIEKYPVVDAYYKGLTKHFEEYLSKREPRPF